MLYNEKFAEWIEKYLKNFPFNIVAVNFNIYEGSNSTYDLQMIGVGEFDKEDEDWACEEIFSTKEDFFYIPITHEIENWEDGLSFITNIIQNYLETGAYAYILKKLQAVGIGFVDGDIEFFNF